jgi:WD40 repeat protein
MKKFSISFLLVVHFILQALNPVITLANESENGISALFTVEPTSELYCLAQTVIWLDDETIAVGKWDGSVTIFKYAEKLSIEQALVLPHKGPVTALAKIDEYSFISSDGPNSLVVWTRGEDQTYFLSQSYQFDEIYGAVDCALLVDNTKDSRLLTGHINGYLLVWKVRDGLFDLEATMDLRSDDPIDSPFPLSNIRKIAFWKNDLVITASEDGDLCLVDFIKNQVKHRQRYNQTAKRGINDIAILGDYLLLSNCSVGTADKNLWLYRIERENFTCLDSLNLISDQANEQVFTFQLGLLSAYNHVCFVCTSGERLLWFGKIKNNRFYNIHFRKNSLSGGAALALHPSRKLCASANYNIKILEFEIYD